MWGDELMRVQPTQMGAHLIKEAHQHLGRTTTLKYRTVASKHTFHSSTDDVTTFKKHGYEAC